MPGLADRTPRTRGSRRLLVASLGRMDYADALELQRNTARDRISEALPDDVLMLVEHPPVVTLGRSSKRTHLIAPPEDLARRGVGLYEVERGGDVTFHGPGQLVGYPIFDLTQHKKDLHWYLRAVEAALIAALGAFDLRAHQREGFTGVWVNEAQPRKIASIGVHARDWVTWHGFALNVATDLSYFDLMVPCGISDVRMTSVVAELGPRAPSLSEVAHEVTRAFASSFNLTPEEFSLAGTGRITGG